MSAQSTRRPRMIGRPPRSNQRMPTAPAPNAPLLTFGSVDLSQRNTRRFSIPGRKARCRCSPLYATLVPLPYSKFAKTTKAATRLTAAVPNDDSAMNRNGSGALPPFIRPQLLGGHFTLSAGCESCSDFRTGFAFCWPGIGFYSQLFRPVLLSTRACDGWRDGGAPIEGQLR